MPRRLFLALLLLVAAPMVLLGWMSANAVKTNQITAKESLANLLSSQLYDADRLITQLFESYAERLNSELDSGEPDFEMLRRLRRKNPIVRQGIYVDKNGVMLFPPPEDSIGFDARVVAAALPGLVDARPLPPRESDSDSSDDDTPEEEIDPALEITGDATSKQQDPSAAVDPTQSDDSSDRNGQQETSIPTTESNLPLPSELGDFPDLFQSNEQTEDESGDGSLSENEVLLNENAAESAWQQWYMADGAQVIYWRTIEEGATVGVLLERSRWMADLIAVLPDNRNRRDETPTMIIWDQTKKLASSDLSPTPIGSVSLVDEAKRSIYRWGDPAEFKLPPLVTSELSIPLSSWQLRLHVDQSLIPSTSPVPMYLSLGGIGVLLLAVGFYVLTAVRRQIADARSRVSFAGQVSHELRTPLTNIRLYTELAESDLERVEESESRSRLSQRLEVIDHESRRLQRLVSGVMEMIRPSGKRVGVRKKRTDIEELVTGIAAQFEPSFKAAGLSLRTESDCPAEVTIDPDIIEMVLVNLLSNVERYVPRGGQCVIRSDMTRKGSPATPHLRIVVCDDGPGIGSNNRSKVFRPFERIDDSISAPSGTGIGLTIARRAAQRHSGDLILQYKSELGGAAFELTLPIDAIPSETQ